MSVYDSSVQSRPVKMRCIATFHIQNGQLDCQCGQSKYFCIHQVMAVWFLNETNQLQSSITEVIENAEQYASSSDDVDSSNLPENPAVFGNFLYPPQEINAITSMCTYLTNDKQVPIYIPQDVISTSNESIPKAFLSAESLCHQCNIQLKGPLLFSKNVKILTKNGLLHGYATFIKICPDCKMCYRYQEYTDEMHNFDDRFFLSLDMCIFIRENVKQHVAVRTVCKILEQYLHIKLKQQTVLNAYMHFATLCAHKYDFICLVCGFHPPVLLADQNRKVVFKCRNVDNQVADCDNSIADYVNCEEVWNTVEMNIVMKGFTSSTPSDLQVKPSILNWSPYMGRFTRSNTLMVNTEHRKSSKQSGEIEADCRELSEDHLIEFMHKEKAVEIRQIARKAGVSDKGSKLDIINRVQRALHGDKAKFNKIFKKLWGCSGGWLTITCPHGIIYGVNFLLRLESPIDYIDMLRSMQHRSNVFVCDMAHMVAVQSNRYKEDFFSPFIGRVVENTAENIEKAMSGDLTVSFPFLEDSTPAKQHLIDSDWHPVTVSNV